jgi:hypothetical protein
MTRLALALGVLTLAASAADAAPKKKKAGKAAKAPKAAPEPSKEAPDVDDAVDVDEPKPAGEAKDAKDPKDPKDKETAQAAEEEAAGEEEEEEEDTSEPEPEKPKPKAPAKAGEFKKQDLRGHAVDQDAGKNIFLKDRFFADKLDTPKTEKGTLVQGSISTSTFAYTESGGTLGMNLGDSGSKFNRLFGEVRLQTDFRHIGGGAWDARIDVRARAVNTPDETSLSSDDTNHVQSGFNGTNELEVREAWLVRSGKRSDLFFGRQFITDLGAVKIDGLRIDYAQSEKFTLISFAGLYPLRGSRSLTTDYIPLKDNSFGPAGRFVGSGGFGAAYRTLNMHGAFGGVALVPFSSEAPRVYGTANGYLRSGPKLDLYHFAILDVVGSAGFALTNLSAGANFKPNQRLRLTASVNHVDTETLNVQANAFLSPGDPDTATGGGKIQNETFVRRLSTTSARGSVSAGLGSLQRFEITVASAFRYRPAFSLTSFDGMTTVNLAAAKGVDVFASLMDRRSFADLRLGVDVSRSFAIGTIAFQRSSVLAARVFGAREFRQGRGEIEAELGYATTKDTGGGTMCAPPMVDPTQCFGTSKGSILSLGGNVFYRFNSNWFGLGSVFVSRQAITRAEGTAVTEDPPILGVTGFGRIAYRF